MSDGTINDGSNSALAVVAFALVLYVPGHLVASLLGLFTFQKQPFVERTAWSIVVSFLSVPLTAYLLGKGVGLGVVCWVLVALAAFFVLAQFKRIRYLRWPPTRASLLLVGAACVWTCFVLLSLVDVQIGHRLYFSVIQFDQSYRVAFTNAVLRTGVPPANPLYFSGHLQSMRYYYFWYVVCALCAKIAHVSAQQAFIASSVWTGFGLVAIIYLFVLHFLRNVHNVRAQTLIAIGLLAVTGADLLPAIGSLFAQPALNGEMEWWSIDQFYSWQDSILWVPHHTASLLCCLAAFLLLWRTQEDITPHQRAIAVTLAAVGYASSLGLSVYVAFGFLLLMLAWLAYLLTHTARNVALCQRLLYAGILSCLLSAPFLHELLSAHSTAQGGKTAQAAHMFQLSVRRMIDPELVTSQPIFHSLLRAHPTLFDTGMRLLLLLPGLGLELGVYGAVLILLVRARRRAAATPTTPAHETLLFLAAAGLVMVLFVRSSVISNNDFAYRASLFPQFFLLLLTADLLASWWVPGRRPHVPPTPRNRWLIYTLLLLGIAGTAYQALMLRFFLPLEARNADSGFKGLPERVYQVRRALAILNRTAPESAVVAFNPVDPKPTMKGDVVSPFTFFSRSMLMSADRQLLSAEPTCASQFGGDVRPCQAIERGLARLYATPGLAAADARAFCARFGVQFLIASSLDPIWTDPTAWAATLPTLDSEPDLRVVRCSQ